MSDYTVFSRRFLTGTIADLPYYARLAWAAILFEAEKLRGKVKLPVRDLARWASITTPEAAESIQRFLEPDPYSSSKEEDGRRLTPIGDEEDWYNVVTWEKHAAERAAYFNRLRQQKWRSKRNAETKESNESALLSDENNRPLCRVTKEPELDQEQERRIKNISPNAATTGRITEGQHLYLADQIGKWVAENGSLYVGGSEEDYAAAFQRRFGMTPERWAKLKMQRGLPDKVGQK